MSNKNRGSWDSAFSAEEVKKIEENRTRAMAGVQGIFDRYKLVRAKVGSAYDNAVMAASVILDASIGPPYEVPAPILPISAEGQGRGEGGGGKEGQQSLLPPPPNTGIVASSTSKLLIGPEWGNYNGVMHGGAAGVIFDMLTTIALGPVARPGFWSFMGGVTRTLNISYLKAVPIGTTVIVHAYLYQVGRQTAYIKGWMTSEDGTTMYAVCDHHKIHVPTPEDHMELRIPWDDLWDEDGKEKTTKTPAKL